MSKTPAEPPLPSLEELGNKISALKKQEAEPVRQNRKEMGLAMRMGVEMVSCVCIGTAGGYFIDKWLGTLPIFLLICFGLGAAAGFITLLRTAGEMQRRNANNEGTKE